jgi:hypothetical protein
MVIEPDCLGELSWGDSLKDAAPSSTLADPAFLISNSRLLFLTIYNFFIMVTEVAFDTSMVRCTSNFIITSY